MAIITFWSTGKRETAKTMSTVAVATKMAIEHNLKTLVVSTSHNDDSLENCFWEPKNEDFINEINGNKKDISSGIDGLVKLKLSNKLTPNIISNYTRLVFQECRLEVLTGSKDVDYQEYEKVREIYKDVIEVANEYYDYVFIDLDKGLDKNYVRDILKISDLIIVNITQSLKMINEIQQLKDKDKLFEKDNVLYLIGRYDKYSKYNSKNIARTIGYKGEIYTVPYSTLFFEACNEGKVADFFLRFRNLNPTDRNAVFIEEIEKISGEIINKIKAMKKVY